MVVMVESVVKGFKLASVLSSLSKAVGNQGVLMAGAALSVITGSCLMTAYLVGAYDIGNAADESPASYTSMAFDEQRAESVCQQEARERFGPTLLRAYVDEHSTRYEKKKGFYMIVLRADVGTIEIYDEALVYCHINPNDFAVSYYRASSAEESMISRTLNFFK